MRYFLTVAKEQSFTKAAEQLHITQPTLSRQMAAFEEDLSLIHIYTYIQSEGINQDFGVYDCPDELLKEHHQEISAFKAFVYRHIGRHLMNRNVRKIRER